MVPDVEAEIPLDGAAAALDLRATMSPLGHGPGDPTIRFAADGVWRGTRTPSGTATLHLRRLADRLVVRAWGPGAEIAASDAPAVAGLLDTPAALVPRHRILIELVRRRPGMRLTRSNRPWEALMPAILEQKVTGTEAHRSWHLLVRTHGEPAPGPAAVWVAPSPATIGALPYYTLHRFGIERRRADVLRRAARIAERLEATPDLATAARLLGGVPGIGPWTVAEVLRVAYGDPDAVSVGDFHLPHLVAWLLAGEPRGSDARMLELLAPYAGQRGRVQRLLESSGMTAPRRGPRLAPRSIAGL